MYDRYQSPLSERYASKEMQYIFSPDKKFKTWRKLWIALAETEYELGLDSVTKEQIEELKNYVEAKGLTFLPISAATRQGVDGLPALVYNRLKGLPPIKVYEAEYKRPDKSAEPTRPFTVTRTGDHEFTVDAPWLERILAGTNVEDYESLQYFQTQLGDSGILDKLVEEGVEEDDTIKIGEYEFDYLY